MFVKQSAVAKGLVGFGIAVTTLVMGAWILPSDTQMERGPVGPIHTPVEVTPDANAARALTVDINFPAQIQHGQYCVAYGLVWGGTPPYTFEWWGGSLDTWDGPLGSNQIAGAYFSGEGYLGVTVDDSGNPTKTGYRVVVFETGGEYNPDCEG